MPRLNAESIKPKNDFDDNIENISTVSSEQPDGPYGSDTSFSVETSSNPNELSSTISMTSVVTTTIDAGDIAELNFRLPTLPTQRTVHTAQVPTTSMSSDSATRRAIDGESGSSASAAAGAGTATSALLPSDDSIADETPNNDTGIRSLPRLMAFSYNSRRLPEEPLRPLGDLPPVIAATAAPPPPTHPTIPQPLRLADLSEHVRYQSLRSTIFSPPTAPPTRIHASRGFASLAPLFQTTQAGAATDITRTDSQIDSQLESHHDKLSSVNSRGL